MSNSLCTVWELLWSLIIKSSYWKITHYELCHYQANYSKAHIISKLLPSVCLMPTITIGSASSILELSRNCPNGQICCPATSFSNFLIRPTDIIFMAAHSLPVADHIMDGPMVSDLISYSISRKRLRLRRKCCLLVGFNKFTSLCRLFSSKKLLYEWMIFPFSITFSCEELC